MSNVKRTVSKVVWKFEGHGEKAHQRWMKRDELVKLEMKKQ